MIEMAPQFSHAPIKTQATPPDPARAGDFTRSLAGFLDSLDPAAPSPPPAIGRKTPAVGGKRLPQDDGADKGKIDPSPIWMPAMPTPVTSVAVTLPGFMSLPARDASAGDPAVADLPLAPDRSPAVAGERKVGEQSSAVFASDEADAAISSVGDVTGAENAIAPDARSARTRASAASVTPPDTIQPRETGKASDPRNLIGVPPALVAAAAPASLIQFASHAVAAAGAVATLDQRLHTNVADARDPAAPLAGLQPDATPAPVVQPAAEAHRAPLGLTQDRGLLRMIDHIEALRDDADARDTRIHLVPDALGSVDVAVRREGDSVHVHFTAEIAATRAMLSEAQPRLAELAHARGLTLGGATVDSGGGGGGAPRRPAAAARPTAARPISPDLPETADRRVA